MQNITSIILLERHQVIDVLPDREAETLTAWLKAHPGVELISRDRGGAYAECGFQTSFAGFSKKCCSADEHKDPLTHHKYSR